jgi:hypothetical protein
MLQSQLIALINERATLFAWFLGVSRTEGLPTAGDIIWGLKRGCYRKEESRAISAGNVAAFLAAI